MEIYLVTVVDIVVRLVSILLIANALISFAPLDPWHPVRRTLNQLSEPILRPFRGLIPPIGGLDFSPILALIVIQIIGIILTALIRSAF